MTGPKRSFDAIVVGGGIIGCTLAYELQRRGRDTLILERGAIGREASWASAGIIGAPTAAGLPQHRAELAERSAKAYDPLFESVQADSGLDSTYLRTGKLLVARTEPEVEGLQADINWQHTHGFESTWLERDDVREIEPIIPDDILGALYTEDGGAMTLHRFTETVAVAFRNRGGIVEEHTPVDGLVIDGDRVTGVRTMNSTRMAPVVVLAAGAWTSVLGLSHGFELPMMPVKGQMISVAPGPGTPRPRHVVGNVHGGYLVPRIDGTVAVGASREDAGFDKRLTPSGIEHGLHLIKTLGPALLDADFVTGWAGLRPGTADESPIMGPVPNIEGLWISTGHYRTGAQLAPGSALLLADAITGERDDPLLAAFSPARFSRG
jgi:glycine oxidase